MAETSLEEFVCAQCGEPLDWANLTKYVTDKVLSKEISRPEINKMVIKIVNRLASHEGTGAFLFSLGLNRDDLIEFQQYLCTPAYRKNSNILFLNALVKEVIDNWDEVKRAHWHKVEVPGKSPVGVPLLYGISLKFASSFTYADDHISIMTNIFANMSGNSRSNNGGYGQGTVVKSLILARVAAVMGCADRDGKRSLNRLLQSLTLRIDELRSPILACILKYLNKGKIGANSGGVISAEVMEWDIMRYILIPGQRNPTSPDLLRFISYKNTILGLRKLNIQILKIFKNDSTLVSSDVEIINRYKDIFTRLYEAYQKRSIMDLAFFADITSDNEFLADLNDQVFRDLRTKVRKMGCARSIKAIDADKIISLEEIYDYVFSFSKLNQADTIETSYSKIIISTNCSWTGRLMASYVMIAKGLVDSDVFNGLLNDESGDFYLEYLNGHILYTIREYEKSNDLDAVLKRLEEYKRYFHAAAPRLNTFCQADGRISLSGFQFLALHYYLNDFIMVVNNVISARNSANMTSRACVDIKNYLFSKDLSFRKYNCVCITLARSNKDIPIPWLKMHIDKIIKGMLAHVIFKGFRRHAVHAINSANKSILFMTARRVVYYYLRDGKLSAEVYLVDFERDARLFEIILIGKFKSLCCLNLEGSSGHNSINDDDRIYNSVGDDRIYSSIGDYKGQNRIGDDYSGRNLQHSQAGYAEDEARIVPLHADAWRIIFGFQENEFKTLSSITNIWRVKSLLLSFVRSFESIEQVFELDQKDSHTRNVLSSMLIQIAGAYNRIESGNTGNYNYTNTETLSALDHILTRNEIAHGIMLPSL